MKYNIDPVTPFKLSDNQRNGSPLPSSLSSEYMTINDHAANMENSYQSMEAKAHTKINKSQVAQQKKL